MGKYLDTLVILMYISVVSCIFRDESIGIDVSIDRIAEDEKRSSDMIGFERLQQKSCLETSNFRGLDVCRDGSLLASQIATNDLGYCRILDTKHTKKLRRRILAVCIPPMDGCSSCQTLNQTLCKTCKSYYWKDSNSICQLCSHSNCSSCTNATACLSCDSPWKVDIANYCVCPQGYYTDSSGICKPCIPGCLSCDNSATCLTCKPFYTMGGMNASCTTCVPNCKDCNSTTSCFLCNINYVLEGSGDTTCKRCDPGLFWLNYECVNCIPNCQTCEYSVSNCTSCAPFVDLVDNTCRAQCPKGTFFNPPTNSCEGCPYNCDECDYSNTTEKYCSVCKPQYWKDISMSTGQCSSQTTCGVGKFRNLDGTCTTYSTPYMAGRYKSPYTPSPLPLGYAISPTGLPVVCPSRCSQCDPTGTTCYRCEQTYGIFNFNMSECVKSLANGGKVGNDGNLISPATSKYCRTESLDGNCIECKDGAFPRNDGKCTFNCPANKKFTTTSCVDDDPYCEMRDSTEACVECATGYFISVGTCIPCHPSCKNCSGIYSTDCTECNPRYNMISPGVCVIVCEPGNYYDMISGSCKPGAGNCYTYAESSNTCTSCVAGKRLVGGTCSQDYCNGSSYWDTGSSSCKPCDSSCVTCADSGPSQCLSCPWGSEITTSPGTCILIPPTSGCTRAWGTSQYHCIDPAPAYFENNDRIIVEYRGYCTEGFYYDYPLKSCQSCNSACYTCLGPTDNSCSVCAEGYRRILGRCVSTSIICDIYNGYTIDSSDNCIACSETNCLVCQNKDFCEHCINGMAPDSSGICQPCGNFTTYCQQFGSRGSLGCVPGYLSTLNSNCSKMCKHGELLHNTGYCTPCLATCDTCFYATSYCLSCRPGDYRVAYACYQMFNMTMQAYFFNTTSNDTEPCPFPCHTCNSNGSLCLSCVRGYYFDSAQCSPCNDLCYDCIGTADNCTRCHVGYSFDNVNNTCTPVCEKYEYYDIPTKSCLLCSPNCMHCSLTNKDQCTKCHPGSYLTSGVCKPCFETCESCNSSAINDCNTCKVDFQLNNAKCVKLCPNHFYLNTSTYQCHHCHFSCQTCVGPSMYNCTSCSAGSREMVNNSFVTDFPSVVTGVCKKVCEHYETFTGVGPNYCKPCHRSCYNCTSPSPLSCISCSPGYYLEGSVCLKCHQFCLNCNGPSLYDCTSCLPPATLESNGYCKKVSCTPGKFLNHGTNTCDTCHSSCQECFNGTFANCYNCSGGGLLLANNTCISSCGTGRYYDGLNLSCKACHPTCKDCVGDQINQCEDCFPENYIQENGTCMLGCAEGSRIPTTGQYCIPCHTSCSNCTGYLETECNKCYEKNYLFINNTCQSSCIWPMIKVDGYKCRDCHPNCETCSGESISDCLTCRTDRQLSSDNQCIRICLNGYYPDLIADSCGICNIKCETCSGPTEFECTKCKQGLVVLNGKCEESCGSRYFLDDQNICVPCHLSCKECSGSGINQCTECFQGMVYLLNSTCASSCPPKQYVESNTRCEMCHHICDICTGPLEVHCSSCPNPVTSILVPFQGCVDCLNSPDAHPETCYFHVSLQLTKAVGSSRNLKASITLKLGFLKDYFYTSRLSPEMLKNVTQLELMIPENITWNYEFRFHKSEILIDMFFSKSLSGEHEIILTPNQTIILTNPTTRIAELIFRNHSASLMISIVGAPNLKLLEALSIDPETANKIGSASSVFGAVTSIIVAGSSSGASGPLIKLMTTFKLINRLRLININYGPYLEMFLSFCSTLFKVGGDTIGKEEIQANPNTRGKLNEFKVSVIITKVMPLYFVAYILIVVLRIYRAKIRTYAWGVGHLTKVDYLINMMAEVGRVTFVSFLCIDIFFYSLHSAAHTSITSDISDDATLSYYTSLFFCVVIPLEFADLFVTNSGTTFPTLRTEFREFISAKARLAESSSSDLDNLQEQNIKPKGEKAIKSTEQPQLLKIRHGTCKISLHSYYPQHEKTTSEQNNG